MKTLADLIAEVTRLKQLSDETDGTLKEKINAFMNSEEILALKKLGEETAVELVDAQQELIAHMQKEKLTTTQTDAGRATISRSLSAGWDNDEKLIAVIRDGKHADLEEFVETKTSLKRVPLKKALLELLEIDGDEALEEAGVAIEESVRLTVTPPKA